MRRWIAILICGSLTAGAAWAQHEGSHKEGSHKEGQSASDDMQKMMEAWAKVAAPGEGHAALDSMAGDWDVSGKFRMTPDGEWMDSPSEAKIAWVLGGRFLRQDVHSEPNAMMPQPFDGIGYLGYNNATQEYVSSWMDTMATAIIFSTGPGSDGKIALKGSYFDPLLNKDKTYKWIYSIDSKDEFTLTMYEPGPDGEMFVNAVLTYRRKGW